jgi:hypothetical protein
MFTYTHSVNGAGKEDHDPAYAGAAVDMIAAVNE